MNISPIPSFLSSDFGFARFTKKRTLLRTNCGSYVYTAPEILEGKEYDGVAADIWSMGMVKIIKTE